MKQILKISPLIILSLLVILLSTEKVRFGYGLGDIAYYGLVFIGLFIYIVYFIATKEEPKEISLAIPILSLIFCGYIILSMTIWRGVEYSWNGEILAPTQKTLEKRAKQRFEKRLARLDNLTNKSPEDYDLRVEKGFFFRSNGKYELAIEEFKVAIKINPEKYNAYWELGYVYSLMDDYNKAIQKYEKAFQIDSTKHELQAEITRLKEKNK